MVAQRFLVPFVGVQIPVSLPLLKASRSAGRLFCCLLFCRILGIFTFGVLVRVAPGLVVSFADSEQNPVSLPLFKS